MTNPRRTRAVTVLALALALPACGTGQAAREPAPVAPAAVAPAAEGLTLDVVNIAFKPDEVRVLRGTEVTWVNADAGVAHTVTSGVGGSNAVAGVSDGQPSRPDGTFDGRLPAEGSFSFTFNERGIFSYFCEVHPSMRGTVVVD